VVFSHASMRLLRISITWLVVFIHYLFLWFWEFYFVLSIAPHLLRIIPLFYLCFHIAIIGVIIGVALTRSPPPAAFRSVVFSLVVVFIIDAACGIN
jgi:hypothetical protein